MGIALTIQQKRATYYDQKKAEGYYGKPCPLCGGQMSLAAKRCARHRADGTLIDESTCECGAPACTLKGPHRRCDCGEAVFPGPEGNFVLECGDCVRWSARMAAKRLRRVS